MNQLKFSGMAMLSLIVFSGCVTETVNKSAERAKSELTMTASSIDRDSQNGIVYLHVHARVQQGPRILKAEHIEVNKRSGILFADENCVYQNGKTVKKAQAMKFKLNGEEWTEL